MDIAHGVRPVDIGTVAAVVGKLGIIQRVAYRFLQDWRDNFLYADWDSQRHILPDFDEDTLSSS